MTNQEIRIAALKLVNDVSGILLNTDNEVSGKLYRRVIFEDVEKAIKAYRLLVSDLLRRTNRGN